MIGVDCNILVQLAFGDHPAHGKTVTAVQREILQGQLLAFPAFIVAEFLHVSTDQRRFSPPLTMPEAIAWIEEFLANPATCVLEPSNASLELSLSWLRRFNLGRKRILDTHFAAVLHYSGITRLLTSNPADFTVFGVFEIVTP